MKVSLPRFPKRCPVRREYVNCMRLIFSEIGLTIDYKGDRRYPIKILAYNKEYQAFTLVKTALSLEAFLQCSEELLSIALAKGILDIDRLVNFVDGIPANVRPLSTIKYASQCKSFGL